MSSRPVPHYASRIASVDGSRAAAKAIGGGPSNGGSYERKARGPDNRSLDQVVEDAMNAQLDRRS